MTEVIVLLTTITALLGAANAASALIHSRELGAVKISVNGERDRLVKEAADCKAEVATLKAELEAERNRRWPHRRRKSQP